MPVTVNINGLTCIHQGSGGLAVATLPDVCKTPPNAAPVPYPNIAMAADLVGGTTTITIDGSPAAMQSSMFVKSTGDEAGAGGGVVSQVFVMEATFLSFSPTVTFEGQAACRLTDKMLMNKGNTVCMSGEMQSVLPGMNDSPPKSLRSPSPEEPVFCPITSLFVSCGHGDRNLMVDLVTGDLPLLEVVSSSTKPDKLLVSVDSECGFGHAYCPTLYISYPDGTWKPIDGSGSVALEAPPEIPFAASDWIRILFGLLGEQDLIRQTYLFMPTICNGAEESNVPVGLSTTIYVYPEMSCSGEISLGYAHPKIAEDTETLDYNRSATWTFGGTINAAVGTRTIEYAASSTQKGVDALPLMGALIDKVGKAAFLFDSMKRFGSDMTGEILWPNWKLSSGLELTEFTAKPLVGPKGTFKVAFEPLIGLQLTVSLLNYLIRFAGCIAPIGGALLAEALIMVKKRFSSYQKESTALVKGAAEVEIDLVVKGEIGGAIGLEFQEGNCTADGTKIEGTISVQVEGRIIVKAKIFNIEFAGGGKVGAAAASGNGSEPSKFGARIIPNIEKGRARPQGQLFFTGLAFYYLLYLELAGTGLESKKPKGEDMDEPEFAGKLTDKSKYQRKGNCVLLEPWEWPAKAAAGAASGGGGGW
jgi:hypothetical protein